MSSGTAHSPGCGLAICKQFFAQSECVVQMGGLVSPFAVIQQGGAEYLGAAIVEDAVLDLHAHRLAIAVPFEGACIGTRDADQVNLHAAQFLDRGAFVIVERPAVAEYPLDPALEQSWQ